MVTVESDAESIEEVSDEDDDNVAEAATEMEAVGATLSAQFPGWDSKLMITPTP